MKRFLLLLAVMAMVAGSATWWLHPPSRQWMAAWVPASLKSLVAPADEAAKAATQRRGPPAAPVTVASVTLGDMPVILSAPGTVEAAATVNVKPRVDGQIADVRFKEGELVEKDQILFRLDDRLIRAQIQQVEANIKRDEANMAEAQANYGRRSTLVQKKIVSESAMDTARAVVETLKANIAAGQAALDAQRTQLDYLTIRAPIRGRTGSTTAKPGSNVRAADLIPLVTINQTQPVSVAFAMPQTDIAALRRALASGATAQVTAPGTIPTTRDGKIDFIDNQVDKLTGTLTAKLEVANADEVLWPGQSVDVALMVEVRKGVASVPASAVLPSQQGMLVWVVGSDNRVQPRPVVLDRILGQTAFLTSGVTAGERVVTDGHVRIAAGAAVSVQQPGGPSDAKPGQGSKNDKSGKVEKNDKAEPTDKIRSKENRRS